MRASGFTLVELLLALMILSVLLSAGIPSLTALVADNEVTRARDDLTRALNLARHTAIMRGLPASVCAAKTARLCSEERLWDSGWLVFVDPNRNEECADFDRDGSCDDDRGQIIAHVVRTESTVSIRGNHFISGGVSFDPLGHARWNHGTFTICDLREVARPRGLVVARSGRIRASNDADLLPCP